MQNNPFVQTLIWAIGSTSKGCVKREIYKNTIRGKQLIVKYIQNHDMVMG